MKFFSKNPKKQRKFARSLAHHLRKNQCACHLSKEMRKETGKRSLSVRKGDKVKVMRGRHKGKDGKVSRVDYKTGRIFVEKIIRKKADGTEIQLPIRASNVLITELDRSDDRRFGKEKKAVKKGQETVEKKEPAKKQEKQDIWAPEETEKKSGKKVN